MADNRNFAARSSTGTDALAIDQGLRAYMLGVYNYMTAGLLVTGVVAYALSLGLVQDGQPTQLFNTLFRTPLQWVILLAPLGLVFFLSARIQHLSVATARTMFLVYAASVGLMLSTIFLAYTHVSIASTFFATAAGFGALSLWGYTTKRDLSGWGSFLFIGLIGLVVASIVNFFFHAPAFNFAIAAIGILIFAGFTAYDTQAIKEMYYAGDDSTVAGRKSILGALRLYLDFINLFLFLLRFMGSRR